MTTFKDYPYWEATNEQDVRDQLQQITHIRKDDITQIQNLPNVFVGGRKVGKIPTSSADMAATDRIGDQNYDANYLYILINNSGTAEWRRASLGSW